MITTEAGRTGNGKQSVTSSVCPTSRPSSWPVTSAGMHSLQCLAILSTTWPLSCTLLSGLVSSTFFSATAAKLSGAILEHERPVTDSKTQLALRRSLQTAYFELAESPHGAAVKRGLQLGGGQLFPTLALRVFRLGPPEWETVAQYGAPLVRRAAPAPARGMPVSGLCTEC